MMSITKKYIPKTSINKKSTDKKSVPKTPINKETTESTDSIGKTIINASHKFIDISERQLKTIIDCKFCENNDILLYLLNYYFGHLTNINNSNRKITIGFRKQTNIQNVVHADIREIVFIPKDRIENMNVTESLINVINQVCFNRLIDDNHKHSVIYNIYEISENSFGYGHEITTACRMIQTLNKITKRSPNLKLRGGLFLNDLMQFNGEKFNTGIGINLTELKFSNQKTSFNKAYMNCNRRNIEKLIQTSHEELFYNDYTVLDKLNHYTSTAFKIVDSWIVNDEISDVTYNHILNQIFIFHGVIPTKNININNDNYSYELFDEFGYLPSILKNAKRNLVVLKKAEYLKKYFNNDHTEEIPMLTNDYNTVSLVSDNNYNYKKKRWLTDVEICLQQTDDGLVFYTINKTPYNYYIKLKLFKTTKKNQQIIIIGDFVQVLKMIDDLSLIKIINIPPNIVHHMICGLISIDGHRKENFGSFVKYKFDEASKKYQINQSYYGDAYLFRYLIKYLIEKDNPISATVAYTILTYIDSSLGLKLLEIISNRIE